MLDIDNYESYIAEYKIQYFAIGGVPCPAFHNDLVFFNKKGWNHLLRKNGVLRSPKDQMRRLRLIAHAEYIIRNSRNWNEHRVQESKNEFWSFVTKIDNAKIIVIVRKDYNKKYFFSVMNN